MTIKNGDIVSHAGAVEWGAGKVVEVSAVKVTIHFSDGKNRKIAASHFSTLRPAAAASYLPPPDSELVAKAVPSPRTARKKK
jgi:transcription elongation factor GreA-like protein